MSNSDLLNDLLDSDPNEAATKGIILILRAETRSEIKAMRTEFERYRDASNARMDKFERSVDAVAQQINKMLSGKWK